MKAFLNRKSLLGCLALFLMLLVSSQGLARDYSFPSLEIFIEIQPDGSFYVTEQRRTNFDGEYKGLYQWIALKNNMKVSDVMMQEKGVPYKFNPTQSPGPAGTYYIKESPNQFYVDWSFDARDEMREFTLTYRVDNAILVHQDGAEFYYQFVGNQWEKGVKQVNITVSLPPGASKEEIRAWGHGPLQGNVTIVDAQTVRYDVSSLPAKTMVEGRIFFPRALVAQSNNTTNRMALPEILEEEQGWANQANRRRNMARLDWLFAGLILLGGIVSSILYWRRWGKPHQPEFTGDYYRDLPAPYSPAVLGVLWNMGNVTDKDLTATLLDLARRKYVAIEEYLLDSAGFLKHKEKMGYRVNRLQTDEAKEQELGEHELNLLNFLFTDVDKDGTGSITFQQLEKYARKNKRQFSAFWDGWKNAVKNQADAYKFFDDVAKPQIVGLVVSFGLMFLCVFPFIYGAIATGVGLVISGGILLIVSAVLRRRSPQGSTDFARWQAFRRFLLHFSEISRQEIPALIIWEHYLVYAITLGVAKEVIKQLELVYPKLEDENHYRFGYGWYYYGRHHQGIGNLNQSLTQMTTSIQSAFTQSIAAATSQTSSGSGSGGGFSGGGGGGFGGGGGGAR